VVPFGGSRPTNAADPRPPQLLLRKSVRKRRTLERKRQTVPARPTARQATKPQESMRTSLARLMLTAPPAVRDRQPTNVVS
jgi:hypothetical protein